MAKNSSATKGAQKSTAKKSGGSPGKQASSNGSPSKNGNGAEKDSGVTGLLSNIMHPFRTEKTLDDLFETGLNDIYSAEKQLVDALPLMEEAAQHPKLKKAFSKHLKQTMRHAERLEKIFEKMDIGKTGETCKAMEGLVTESNKVISEFQPHPVRDSALIIAAQKVEHYEMASYGSLAELADVLGYSKAGNLLHATLVEEEETDVLLTEIAMEINDEACEYSAEEEEEDEE
jgi:ferritin-like metal-binding protein YciE